MGANKKARSQKRKSRLPDFVVDELADDETDWTMNFHQDDKIEKLLTYLHEGETVFPSRLTKLMPNLATDLLSKRLDIDVAINGILKRYSDKYNQDCTITEADYLRQQFAHKALEFVPNYRDLIPKSDLEAFQKSITKPHQGRPRLFSSVQFFVKEACRKWESYMDAKLCAGVRGKFLRNCPIYRLTENDLQKMRVLMSRKYRNYDTEEWIAERLVWLPVNGLGCGVVGVKAACWECRKLLEGDNSFSCSCCKTANYCSKICQKSAWKSGHRKKCRSLPDKYNQLQKSFQEVDKICFGAYEKVRAYSLIHSITHSSGKSFTRHFSHLEGPNINIFYKNVKRMRAGWSIFDDGANSMGSYEDQFNDQAQKDGLEEKMFVEAIFVLSFDFVKHAKKRQIHGREIRQFTASYVSVLIKMVGMKLASFRMPSKRFLILYENMSTEWGAFASDDESQSRKMKRVMTNLCLLTFRAMHHKNTTSDSPPPSLILNGLYSEML